MSARIFAAGLFGAPVPPAWLRPVPFKLPKHPALEGEQVRIWEITPEQTPWNVAATVYTALGVDLHTVLTDREGRRINLRAPLSAPKRSTRKLHHHQLPQP